MSEMTISDTIFSMILFRLHKFAIGRSISAVSGGNCFGVGVIVSLLYCFGQLPRFSPELTTSENGTHNSEANSLRILAGMSPGAVALLVLIPSRYFFICCGLNWGIVD